MVNGKVSIKINTILMYFILIQIVQYIISRVSPRKMRKHHGNLWFGFSAARIVYENFFIYSF